MNYDGLGVKTVVRPNKKIPVVRVIRPYLNLLVNPRIFIGFLSLKVVLI